MKNAPPRVRDAMRFLDAAIDDVADRITAWAEQIVLDLHEPVRIDDEFGRPTGEVLCSAHRQRTDWPCTDVQRVTDARAARLRAQESAPPQPEG